MKTNGLFALSFESTMVPVWPNPEGKRFTAIGSHRNV